MFAEIITENGDFPTPYIDVYNYFTDKKLFSYQVSFKDIDPEVKIKSIRVEFERKL